VSKRQHMTVGIVNNISFFFPILLFLEFFNPYPIPPFSHYLQCHNRLTDAISAVRYSLHLTRLLIAIGAL